MKKPKLKRFIEVSKSCNGNITAIAKTFSVSRRSVHNWMNEDEDYKDAVDDFKGALLDECITISRAVALGIPERDEQGRFIGWIEKPDPSMLRYFMSTLGRNEGFGENIDITSKGEQINQVTVFELPDNGRNEDKQD